MRTLEAALADLRALARPVMRWGNARAIAEWRAELDAWKAATPGGELRYETLLAEVEAIEKDMAQRQRSRGGLKRAGIDTRTIEALEALERTDDIRCVEEWFSTPTTWLVLLGSLGIGKTVVAARGVELAINAGLRARLVPAVSFARVAGGFDGEADALASLDLLVIDDFGVENLSDFARSVFADVLSTRHGDRRKTIICTNMDGAGFRERIGERLADRVRSDCVARHITGTSRRSKQDGKSLRERGAP